MKLHNIIMLQMQQQISEYKSDIETSFKQALKQVKSLYCNRIEKLEGIISDKDSQIAKVESEIKSVNFELATLKELHVKLQQKEQNDREQIENLKNSIERLDKSSQNELSLRQKMIKQLQSKIYQQNRLIQKLINQQEVFSTNYSSVSKQQSPSFSVEITQLFKNSPHEILKFLDSIPGEMAADPKEQGYMTCMFVSKDGMSLQKFVKINRTFLKRTIKEHQKRFRFVLIHKPDKQ